MLDETVEINLAQKADVNELQNLFNHSWLCIPAQIALIARGDAELIKLYMESYRLSEEAQCELVKLGNRELLLIAAKKALVSPKAISLLVEKFVK